MIKRILQKLEHIFRLSVINLNIFVYNNVERRQQMRKLPSKIVSASTSLQHLHFNSDKKRTVEITELDLNRKEIIVTCYFTLKPDPQTGKSRNSAEFQFIQPWYDSIIKIGASGIVLHDGLDTEFIENYQNEQIQFRYCEMGNYSIFEERWLLYHILLDQLPQLEKVFFTDSNDVFITKNPFDIIDNSQALYVGRDNANRIKDSGWLKEECSRFLEESIYTLPKTYEYQWVYNAGVTGGGYPVMLFLTSEMAKLIFKASSDHHKDMTLLNIVIHEHFHPFLSNKNWEQQLVDTRNDILASHSNLMTGYPFNSGFKDHDFDSTAYFIHK
jgi:hypothetical protein